MLDKTRETEIEIQRILTSVWSARLTPLETTMYSLLQTAAERIRELDTEVRRLSASNREADAEKGEDAG